MTRATYTGFCCMVSTERAGASYTPVLPGPGLWTLVAEHSCLVARPLIMVPGQYSLCLYSLVRVSSHDHHCSLVSIPSLSLSLWSSSDHYHCVIRASLVMSGLTRARVTGGWHWRLVLWPRPRHYWGHWGRPQCLLPGLSLSRLCLSLTRPGSWSILGTKCDSHTLGPHQWPLQFSARLMPPLLQSDLLNQCQTAWFIFWMEKKRVVKLNVRLIFYLIHLTHCWHCSWLVPVFLAMCPHPSSSWCSWTHLTVVTPHDLINTHLASNWGLL